MQVIGFISTYETRHILEEAYPSGTWHVRPQDNKRVDQDVTLVLHVSQSTDGGIPCELFECFEACVRTLCMHATSLPDSIMKSRFYKHEEWILANREQIRCLVLTSGAPFDSSNVTNARAQLEKVSGLKLDLVVSYEAKELAKLLSRSTASGDLLVHLSGTASEELALQTLSSLLPFGLVWETGDKGTRAGLISSAREVDLGGLSSLEHMIAGRLIEHTQTDDHSTSNRDWGIDTHLGDVSRLGRLLDGSQYLECAKSSIKDQDSAERLNHLDTVLRYLSLSPTLDDWILRLSKLRDALLKADEDATI